jgi:HPt (histidine-containing phosphotransfer) domain-containing protein
VNDLHIDRTKLYELQEVMGDDYLVLLDTFLKDSSGRLGQLHEAKSPEELEHAAHSFKGSSANMGAQRLSDLCHRLEKLAQQKPATGVEDLVNQIEQEYAQVRQLFEDERARFRVASS